MNRKKKGTMRLILYSLFLALLSFGCRSVKHKQVSTKSDSTTVQQSYFDSSLTSHSIEVRDTSVVIPFRRVSGAVSLADLLPHYTAQGKPVANRLEVKNGGLKGFLTINPDSTIEYGAEVDSMALVFKNLTREVIVLAAVKSSLESKVNVSKSERMEWREIRPFIDRYGPWGLIVLFIIVMLPKSKK